MFSFLVRLRVSIRSGSAYTLADLSADFKHWTGALLVRE